MPAKPQFALTILLLLLLLVACTLPVPVQLTPEASPSPNLTMTAVFSTPLPTQPLPTGTLPNVITATSQPTGSQPATLTPQATNTSVPPTAVPPTATAVPPTNTPVPPTKTPLPPTATADISRRPGTTVQAAFMAIPPVLDGGWTDFPVHDYAIPFVVYGKQNWQNSDDLSASFRVGWDKNNLYLAAKVRDDVYAQNASGADIFKGDSLELLLDANVARDFYVQQTGSDDYQLGISFGRPDVNGVKESWLWQPGNVAGSRTQVKIAATRNETEHLTQVEVIIPWSVFGIMPKSGMHLGFALSVSDNDDTTKNVQQTMISSAQNRGLFDPTTWGDLLLK
jgi:hypothetical protein